MNSIPALPGTFTPPCRLLVIDIDGTFLNSHKQITPAVSAAVRDLAATGTNVAFATGRMWEAVSHWAREMGFSCPQIANNGADVVDPETDKRLVNICLSPETVCFLLDTGNKLGYRTVLFSGKRVLGTARTSADMLIERNNEFVEEVGDAILRSPETATEKALFLSLDRQDEFADLRDRLIAETTDLPNVEFSVEITEPGILNFCHPQARKVCAVDVLAEHLGIPLSQVIAIGDGDNDAEVLSHVGCGIAMGNASPRAREAADLLAPDNDHDGLAWAISEIVLPLALCNSTG